jgi:hypothetical protein
MDHEDERPGRVRLPGYEQPGPAGSSRTDGVRRVRRAGNWTAAALIAGVAAASGYFAHHLPPAGPVATQAPVGGQVAAAAGHGVTAARPHPSSGSAPMVTSGGSGVAVGPAAGPAGTGSAGGGAASVVWRDN